MSSPKPQSRLAALAHRLSRVPLGHRSVGPGSHLSFRRQLVTEAVQTSLPLLFADCIALALGLGFGRAFVDLCGGASPIGLGVMVAALAWMLVVHVLLSLYPGTALAPVDELRRTCISAVAVFGAVTGWLAWHGSANTVDLISVAIGVVTTVCAVALLRPAMRRLCAPRDWWGQSTIVFADDAVGNSLVEALRAHPEHGLKPVAVVTPDADQEREHFASWAVRVLNPDEHEGPDLFTSSPAIPNVMVVHPRWAMGRELWSPIIRSLGVPGIRITNRLLTLRSMAIKRVMDLVVAGLVSLALLPILASLALLVRVSSSGPIFYGHWRIGRGGSRFRAWKFRTMVPDADQRLREHLANHPEARAEWLATQKLTDDPRITKIGHLLRKTSLDELPQLWNVLRGDMSLVGPRPIVEEEVAKYGPVFGAYLQVRPGITGLWQVSGRNDTTYPQRIQLDAFYVRNWSPWLDLYIGFRTFFVVARREGAR